VSLFLLHPRYKGKRRQHIMPPPPRCRKCGQFVKQHRDRRTGGAQRRRTKKRCVTKRPKQKDWVDDLKRNFTEGKQKLLRLVSRKTH
jgi:hypothetical protein